MVVNSVVSRIPNGVCVREKTNGYKTSHLWYKPGMTVYDEVNPDGATVAEADYTKAELVVRTPLDIYPVTDEQGMRTTRQTSIRTQHTTVKQTELFFTTQRQSTKA